MYIDDGAAGAVAPPPPPTHKHVLVPRIAASRAHKSFYQYRAWHYLCHHRLQRVNFLPLDDSRTT